MGIFGKDKKKHRDREPRKRRVWGIRKETLQLIMEVSKDNYPREFAATLIAKKGIIEEINLLPGTISGGTSATLQLYMQPPDITLSVVGVVHSHPSGNVTPSGQDVQLFGRFGHTHIIVGVPYDLTSWKAYDAYGQRIELEVVE
jgi:proteasome lid subunit RPN8/RPN11